MKTQTIKIPVYHGYIHVSLVKDAGFNCSAYTERDKNKRCTYWLVIKKSKLSHALIAHEVVHLVNLIFIDRGIKLDINNDETQAYFTEWLTDSIYQLLKIKPL